MKKEELLQLVKQLIKEEIQKSEVLLETPKTLKIEKLIDTGGWSYVEIAWVNDEGFQAAQDEILDHNKQFYRIDEVFFFDPSLIASSINKLRSKIRMKKF